MLEARTSAAARPTSARAAAAAKPAACRSKTTNDPMRARSSGNTRQGRRLRDLYASYMAALGHPDSLTTRAAALAACELMVAAEGARSALLAGRGDVDQVVRLENLAARAVRRLGLRPGAALPAYDPSAFQRAIEARGGKAAGASFPPATPELPPGPETLPAASPRGPNGGDKP